VAPVVALCGFLLYRLAPDVGEKPLYEDEAIAGLIAMRPLGEVVETVLADRGGAPLHFVLAHAAFWVDASADALRWLSVLAALVAVPLCFDLGRRLGGVSAGVVAAAVAASSTALAVYGSFGRMYALFVVVAALFADLFVRALHVRTGGAVAAAAAAGWLLPAVHPYGAIPAFVALMAAAAIWRGRRLAAAWPVAVAVVAAVPFFIADLRLADRAAVGGGARALATPGEAWEELVAATSSFAGGDGLPFVFFTALALAGVVVLVRREPAFAALAASVALPPLLFMLVRTDATPDLSPRHLFYGLPLWAAAIGVGATALTQRKLALALVALIAVTSPASALRDPRELGFATASVDTAPSIHARENDLLLPYSAPFLAALSEVRDAVALPHAPGDEILRAVEHAGEPVGAVHVAIPTRPWTVLRLEGPFAKPDALAAAARRLHEFEHSPRLEKWFAWIEPGLCEALRELERTCP
jgi:mannosyltransferase